MKDKLEDFVTKQKRAYSKMVVSRYGFMAKVLHNSQEKWG